MTKPRRGGQPGRSSESEGRAARSFFRVLGEDSQVVLQSLRGGQPGRSSESEGRTARSLFRV